METIISTSEKQTLKIAEKLAKKSKSPLCICLYGNLGAGKTVFSKGFAQGLGIPPRKIKSPTYTLIRKYEVGLGTAPSTKTTLYHCDFYRINEPDDLISSDLEEIFQQKNAIILIEWPERIQNLLPKKRLNITIDLNSKSNNKSSAQTTRIIQISPQNL